ncbi:hypothetical protein Slin15195_G100780 [Septoria linicola]|uniref:Uncharacterized protein n=1 Tax=Septoria linicola TaxID=215465 RepID=A0A9Q9ENM5_9PEZI|nr:hypothetical protein Slin15195_G100780 [Septoria linicola]
MDDSDAPGQDQRETFPNGHSFMPMTIGYDIDATTSYSIEELTAQFSEFHAARVASAVSNNTTVLEAIMPNVQSGLSSISEARRAVDDVLLTSMPDTSFGAQTQASLTHDVDLPDSGDDDRDSVMRDSTASLSEDAEQTAVEEASLEWLSVSTLQKLPPGPTARAAKGANLNVLPIDDTPASYKKAYDCHKGLPRPTAYLGMSDQLDFALFLCSPSFLKPLVAFALAGNMDLKWAALAALLLEDSTISEFEELGDDIDSAISKWPVQLNEAGKLLKDSDDGASVTGHNIGNAWSLCAYSMWLMVHRGEKFWGLSSTAQRKQQIEVRTRLASLPLPLPDTPAIDFEGRSFNPVWKHEHDHHILEAYNRAYQALRTCWHHTRNSTICTDLPHAESWSKALLNALTPKPIPSDEFTPQFMRQRAGDALRVLMREGSKKIHAQRSQCALTLHFDKSTSKDLVALHDPDGLEDMLENLEKAINYVQPPSGQICKPDPRAYATMEEWHDALRCDLKLHTAWQAKNVTMRLGRVKLVSNVDTDDQDVMVTLDRLADENLIPWPRKQDFINQHSAIQVRYAIYPMTEDDHQQKKTDFETNGAMNGNNSK